MERAGWSPPRLRDVARRAGVSPATVSRVLSGNRPVALEIQDAVVAAAADLGYRSSHEPGSYGTIAVIASALDRYGYSDTLTGIIEAARGEKLLVEVHIADSSHPDFTAALFDRILTRPLFGIIVLEFDSVAGPLTHQLPSQVPATIAGGAPNTHDGMRSHCYIDDFSAARRVTHHLLGLGHLKVGYLGIPQADRPEPRRRGWQTALREANLPATPPLGIGWSASRGRRVAEYLAAHRDITAVLCGNDELAMGLIAGLSDVGLSVPGDVSIVGFDDHPLAEHCQPPLSTVRQDFAELGRTATELLAAQVETGRASTRAVSTQFIARHSVAPPR